MVDTAGAVGNERTICISPSGDPFNVGNYGHARALYFHRLLRILLVMFLVYLILEQQTLETKG